MKLQQLCRATHIMSDDNKILTNPNYKLHPRSKHHGRYDLQALIIASPELEKFVSVNKYGNVSIDCFNPNAVKALNKALLIFHYGLQYWDILEGSLCPPIPGRADYIHNITDILASSNNGIIPTGNFVGSPH